MDDQLNVRIDLCDQRNTELEEGHLGSYMLRVTIVYITVAVSQSLAVEWGLWRGASRQV